MGLLSFSRAMSRSRFSFQLYLGWMWILSSMEIFSTFRSYLCRPPQRRDKLQATQGSRQVPQGGKLPALGAGSQGNQRAGSCIGSTPGSFFPA